MRQRGIAIIHCALACAIPCRAPAQSDFRRGDVNADGAVDCADIDRMGRWLYLGDPAPQCLATGDTNDDGIVNDSDEVFLIACLFNPNPAFTIPSPGPDEPGPDPTPGPGCVAYNPAAAAPLASFSLGFDCSTPVMGAPGETVVFDAFATLTTTGNTTDQGAESWSIGIGVEGFHVAGTTTVGTAAALTIADPPGYRDSEWSFEGSSYWSGPEEGWIAAVLLGRRESVGAALPPTGTTRILGLRLKTTVPPDGVATGRLFFAAEDEQRVTKPVPNRVALRGISHVPALESCDIRILKDCNANDQPDVLDISSGVSLDCTSNGIPDECEPDCNENSTADSCDIASGEPDCDANGVIDSCDPVSATDCNQNGIFDACDLADGTSMDCNGNAVPDSCDIAGGTSTDCDSNGIPDSCDVDRPWSEDCNGNDTEDACDIVSGSSLDADGNGIPDECEACPGSGGPVECPGNGDPAFRYGFRGPCGASWEIGAEQELVVFGRLETHCLEAGSPGALGWALSVVVEGCRPTEATTDGTAAALATEGGLRDAESSYAKTMIVDPLRNGKMGAVSAIVLSLRDPVTLPPEDSPHDIIRLTLVAKVSPACSECILRYEDGLFGSGTPVTNAVNFEGGNVYPSLGEMRIQVCPPGFGLQKPGDENQDGKHNISDPVSVLNHLFVGSNPVLPCGDGTTTDEANLAILDLNGSGTIDVSDPIYGLNFLFSGGPPPVMGRACIRVADCPEACRE